MCVLALQAMTDIDCDTNVVASSGTGTGTANGEVQHAAPCPIAAFPWNFEKPSGKGR